jgi:hypothetical protein
MMKLLALPALLLLVTPESTVRMEADGVRVSGELVTGAVVNLRSAGELPVLVSGSAIENLALSGTPLLLSVGEDRRVSLATGLRLERLATGFRISSHGPSFIVEAGGRTLGFQGPAQFAITDKGFDFGVQGRIESEALAARLEPALVQTQDPAAPATQDTPPPSRRRSLALRETSRPTVTRRIFGTGDPTVLAERADSQTVKSLVHLTPVGAP